MVVRSWWWLLLGRGNHPTWYQCTSHVWFYACVCFHLCKFGKDANKRRIYMNCVVYLQVKKKKWKCGCLFSPFFCFAAFDECTIGFWLLFFMQICTSCSEEDYQPLMWHQRYLLIFQFQIILVFESLSIQQLPSARLANYRSFSHLSWGVKINERNSQLDLAYPCISSPESLWWQIHYDLWQICINWARCNVIVTLKDDTIACIF